jgi:1,4-dihydroxy-6-naphthoate synthase
MEPTTLTFGVRRDPDDAFRFHALAAEQLPADQREGLAFRFVEEEVGGLCARAGSGELDVSVLPLMAYGKFADRYRLTSSGFQVGDGYGPVIASSRVFLEDELNESTLVHVPGELSSAYLVLRAYSTRCQVATFSSEDMLPAIVDGRIETGVLTDHSQITFGNFGVYKIEDLGELWKFSSGGLPIVLTGVAVKRSLPPDVQQRIQRVVERSILWGVEHRDVALTAARRHARGANDWTIDKFVGLYVTPHSIELEESGVKACHALFQRAIELGLLPAEPPFDPIPRA